MKRYILSAIILLCAINSFAFSSVSFYIVSHQDDWQLFMGLHGAADINTAINKVIIIDITAGDASCAKGQKVNPSFYLSRESGAINSIEFCSDLKSFHDKSGYQNVTVNGHKIKRYQYKNVENYFLRLPDGCFSCGLNGESLEYLHEGKIASITAVDNSTTYDSWNDLVATVKSIISLESDSIETITLHTSDTDRNINPGDHPDHLYTGVLALQATDSIAVTAKFLHVGYHVERMPVNISPANIALKASLFAMADYGRTQNNSSSAWDAWHLSFISRDYYRITLPDAKPADSILTLYPNPAQTAINVFYNMQKAGIASLQIIDMSGKEVYAATRSCTAGTQTDLIDVTALAPGQYILVIATPSGKNSRKFIKD